MTAGHEEAAVTWLWYFGRLIKEYTRNMKASNNICQEEMDCKSEVTRAHCKQRTASSHAAPQSPLQTFINTEAGKFTRTSCYRRVKVTKQPENT